MVLRACCAPDPNLCACLLLHHAVLCCAGQLEAAEARADGAAAQVGRREEAHAAEVARMQRDAAGAALAAEQLREQLQVRGH